MNAQVLEGKNKAIEFSTERESLSLLASRIFVAIATLFSVAFCLDFVGKPALSQTMLFIYSAMAASAIESVTTIAYQKFLNNRSVRFFYMSAKVIGGINAGALVSLIALIFGDVAFDGMDGYVAIICGVVAGAIAASRVSMPDNGPRTSGMVAAISEEKELSGDDLYLAAVHEAGHALAVSLLDEEHRFGSFVQLGGSQSTFTNVPQIDSMWSVSPYRRAQMLILLAGPVATDIHFGASAEGGRQDLVSWRHKAMSVLTAERAEGWNPQPEDEMSYERNERLISQLEDEQTEALTEFFKVNEDLYYELVDFLFENRGASQEDLEAFFARVSIPELIQEAVR